MAKKVRCPQCGAKNAADARRCRVCAVLINAEVPEQRRGFALSPAELGGDAPPPAPPPAPPAPAPVAPEPVAPAGVSAGPPGDGIVIDAPPRHGAPPPPPAESGFDADVGIVIETQPRNPDVPPPPLEYDGEPFDPDGLIIDPPR